MGTTEAKPPSPTVTALQRAVPLRDQVYQALEEMIIKGILAPGDRLLEVDLAKRLGVSRNPVREAMSALQREGWVEVRPHHGAYVRQPTLKEIEDFFLVRTVLEVEAARLAAMNADSEAVDELDSLVQQGQEALRQGKEQAVAEANNRFHARVVDIADNATLAELLGMMSRRLRWYFGEVALTRGKASWQEHMDLIDAFKVGDADRAALIMQRHANATTNAYRRAHVPAS